MLMSDATIGYLAHEEGVSVQDAESGGPGLAFVTYPKALSLLPASNFFSIVFFLTLFLLGIGRHLQH